jgi:sporulation protein YlmC with PRC-barrel domain
MPAFIRMHLHPLIKETEMDEFTRVLSASTLIGDKVYNPDGEELGKVEELMVDLEQGHIAYAVLSFGGFLGMGSKLFAIPWQALTLDTELKAFILNVSKETLEHAPGFDKENWPDNAKYEAGFLEDVYSYYGYTPHWNTKVRS